MEEPAEEAEHIPWSELLAQHQATARPWLVYVAAFAIAAVVIGVIAARSLIRPSTGTVAVDTSVAAADPAPPPVPAPSPEPAAPTPLAEADLMAVAAPDDVLPAVARAEWFVVEYFTRDGLSARSGELERLLGREPPAPVGEAVTYVEWARAIATEPTEAGVEVTVAFRLLVDDREGFRREPVRAVSLELVAADGWRVADLPAPASVAVVDEVSPFPEPDATVPAAVGEAAVAALGGEWGPATVIGGYEAGRDWQVLVAPAAAGAPLLVDVPGG